MVVYHLLRSTPPHQSLGLKRQQQQPSSKRRTLDVGLQPHRRPSPVILLHLKMKITLMMIMKVPTRMELEVQDGSLLDHLMLLLLRHTRGSEDGPVVQRPKQVSSSTFQRKWKGFPFQSSNQKESVASVRCNTWDGRRSRDILVFCLTLVCVVFASPALFQVLN